MGGVRCHEDVWGFKFGYIGDADGFLRSWEMKRRNWVGWRKDNKLGARNLGF